MVATGLEETQNSSGNAAFPDGSGAESGAHFAESGDFDPQLARLVEAWPALSEAIRESIMAIVDGATHSDE